MARTWLFSPLPSNVFSSACSASRPPWCGGSTCPSAPASSRWLENRTHRIEIPMKTPEDERERRQSAEALARVAEAARGENVPRTPSSVLGPTDPVRTAEPGPAEAPPPAWNPPAPPDLGPVNTSFQTGPENTLRSLFSRLGG